MDLAGVGPLAVGGHGHQEPVPQGHLGFAAVGELKEEGFRGHVAYHLGARFPETLGKEQGFLGRGAP